MKKDLVMIVGIGVPVAILMVAIGGGGHSSFDFEPEDKTTTEQPKQTQSSSSQSSSSSITQSSYSSQDCSGNARCIIGKVTEIIDGDTIKVDSKSIRFALSSAPELNESGGADARKFIEGLCSVGSDVLVDEDDKQTGGSYGRIIGVIYCNKVNLNEELLDANLGHLSSGFCSTSEFENHSWAQKHGCMTSSVTDLGVSIQETQNDCDLSYPDFCIPSISPDLDCKDISQKRFTVLAPDPHRFDGDKDGIGCES
ncbi:MAG: thermonuclease family protein [Nitrosopumilus sp.]|nr:thermonuclease family protein [Nitrosopumilus sp.]MDH3765579.1 thermonuclease family protein [Nitrosopumilus sp.]